MTDGKLISDDSRNGPKTDDQDSAREIEEELEDGRAGEAGLAVDAICTSCSLTRAKRTSELEEYEDPEDEIPVSFTHICHNCQRVTWWNGIRLLGRGSE